MDFSKLSAPSLKELFIREIESMILSHRLPVGEKIPSERELANSMGISRSVVNSGLTELVRKGFLTVKPGIGTFVADYRQNGTIETLIFLMNYNGGTLRNAEIRSILELRIALDSLSISLCISKINQEEIAILKGYVKEIGETNSPSDAACSAYSFQHQLAIFSGNTLTPLIFASCKEPILAMWRRFCRLYGCNALYKNTSVLCNCIALGDKEKAIDWLSKTMHDTISGKRQIYHKEEY